MKAGAFTPAIRWTVRCSERKTSCTLNEGGGLHPRNPGGLAVQVGLIGDRSMKAGAFTPAILLLLVQSVLDGARSMKAGAFTPAIPCPGWSLVGCGRRSMKAGAFTPAIPVRIRSCLCPSVLAQ